MRRTFLMMVATAVGCGGAEAGDAIPGGGSEPLPTPVDVAEAKNDTVIDEIVATGQIEAVQSIELRPEVEGRLVAILVREGFEVREGTPLFKVDDAQLRAQVARLEAERDLAVQALERTRDLISRNASSQADLQQAEANARSSAAQLELQQIRLDRTLVRAPFTGVIGRRFVSLGDYVTTASRLATLQTVNPQRAVFAVPERFAQRLATTQQITFRIAAGEPRQYEGTVEFVDPVVELPGRTITVKARVRNHDRTLKSGMFIEVRLATDVRPDAVVVPEDAVLPLQGLTFVWVVTDGTVTRRPVRLGIRTPGFVEVITGVTAGEHVVVGGLERLFDGAPVMPSLVQRTADVVRQPAN
ncbi:MAG TPA: efflux RND transporter periplasmic adaptor subunit [Gemmatimonadales bacterium]